MTSKPSLKKVTEDEFYAEPSYVSTLNNAELQQHLAQTRDRLSRTLDQIEDKGNVPKQLERAQAKLRARFRVMKKEQPLLLLGIGVGAVVVAGAIIVGVVRSGKR